ncbi:hypothetical protein Bpfe_010418 [Biomphalaria pfeifferi]|uniref:Uncharacterized protein n=1 Tax=Biomphalaria pfeifferi TaxID=112525 RepID=A0AAD8FE86_BIOPF|nr:hypothetical protein Bpfe_010418 [Biomphalaria pfeifferi]
MPSTQRRSQSQGSLDALLLHFRCSFWQKSLRADPRLHATSVPQDPFTQRWAFLFRPGLPCLETSQQY